MVEVFDCRKAWKAEEIKDTSCLNTNAMSTYPHFFYFFIFHNISLYSWDMADTTWIESDSTYKTNSKMYNKSCVEVRLRESWILKID